jgi:hypothetical protein
LKRKKKRYLLILALVLGLIFTLLFSNQILQFLFKEKIWAHKTNTINRLNEAKNQFSGVELDVVFYIDSNSFDVNHPPDKSEHLSLKKYFHSQLNHENFYYWLDFKNLNQANHLDAANKLDSLAKLFNIDAKRVIVESSHPYFLSPFLEKGFNTSYYLPTNLNKLNKKDLDATLKSIKEKINSNNNTYISSNMIDYEILKMHFPHQKKLFWFTTFGSRNKIKTRLLLYQIVLDNNVDAFLIPFDSK